MSKLPKVNDAIDAYNIVVGKRRDNLIHLLSLILNIKTIFIFNLGLAHLTKTKRATKTRDRMGPDGSNSTKCLNPETGPNEFHRREGPGSRVLVVPHNQV